MDTRSFAAICIAATLLLAPGPFGLAQAKGPGGPPPPGGVRPGGPPPPPMNPAGQPHPNQTHRPNANAARPSATAPKSGVQFGPVGRWWDNSSMVRTVGLTQDQKRRMDSIFNASKPAILASYQAYLKEQERLNTLSRSANADQASTFAAIDSVNQARAALQKATAQMYLQLRQQMSPEQIQKLEKIQ